MGRRNRRFSQLERKLRASGGVAAPGSRLANYIDFKKGKRKANTGTRPDPALLQRIYRGVTPFNLSVDPTLAQEQFNIKCAVTVWSDRGRSAVLGITVNDMNYFTPDAVRTDDNFYPATVRVKASSTAATERSPLSGITGKEYKTFPGQAYSFPFGRSLILAKLAAGVADTITLDKVTEELVKEGLTKKIQGVSGVRARGISFEPELIRYDRKILRERDNNDPGNPTLPV